MEALNLRMAMLTKPFDLNSLSMPNLFFGILIINILNTEIVITYQIYDPYCGTHASIGIIGITLLNSI